MSTRCGAANLLAIVPGLSALLLLAGIANAGQLAFTGAAVNGSDGITGIGGTVDVLVSPDGKHLYATGFLDHGLAVFERDETTGLLTYVETEMQGQDGVTGLTGAEGIAISPNGANLYVTGRFGDSLAHFERNDTTGELLFVESFVDGVAGVEGLDGSRDVIVSAEGDFVYASARDDGGVAVFAREIGSGALTFVESHLDGSSGVSGVAGSLGIALSPSGDHLYLAGEFSNAIDVFTTAFMQPAELQVDGVASADGLSGAVDVVVSPDNRFVYVAGEFEDKVAGFGEDAIVSFGINGDGSMTYQTVYRQGEDGIVGLMGPRDLAFSPDGVFLYLASAANSDSAGAVFERNPARGDLRFVDKIVLPSPPMSGESIVLSPDGQNVYVGTRNSVTAFDRNPTNGTVFAPFETLYREGGAIFDGLERTRSLAVSAPPVR